MLARARGHLPGGRPVTRVASVEQYGGGHQPPRDAAPISDLDNPEIGSFPSDVYDHPEYYWHSGQDYDRESAQIIKRLRGKPNAMVTIYRAAPPGVTAFDTGNWVAVSETYCRQHAMQGDGASSDWPVYSASVPAHTVLSGGNDIVEYGYWGSRVPARIVRIGSTIAAPNQVPIFNGSGEKQYAYNAPYVVVGYDSPMFESNGGLSEVNDIKVPVPWDSDLRVAIEKAEQKAEEQFKDPMFAGWASKGNGFYLIFGSGNISVVVGHAKRIGDAWQAVSGSFGRKQADSSYLRILDRPKDAFAQFCKNVADAQPPGFNQHPLTMGKDVVTVYRGISLAAGQDPSIADKGDNEGFGKGAGSSWTLDISVAKAIAERGQAGFSGGDSNSVFGKPRSIKAIPNSSNNNRTRAVLLRATVDLSQEGFGLLNDGRMYYSSEQEVDINPGTEFTLTGWMEADQVPVDYREMQQAMEKAKAQVAKDGYSLADYEITYRWSSSWHSVNVKRTASVPVRTPGSAAADGHLPGGRQVFACRPPTR